MQKGVASLFVCKNLFIIIYKEEKKFKMKKKLQKEEVSTKKPNILSVKMVINRKKTR